MTKAKTTSVRCTECHHPAEVAGKRATWLCPCATTRQDCDCDHLNVVDDK